MSSAATKIPVSVQEAYRAWDWSVAWDLYPGKTVYRMQAPNGEVRFLKLSSGSGNPRLVGEIQRTRWLGQYLPVPEILANGTSDGVDWLISAGIEGNDAIAGEHLADPAKTVQLLAQALRRFHETAPVEECPFDGRLDRALARVRRRADAGLIDPARDFQPEHSHFDVEPALRVLQSQRPESEDLVVCHGDYCAPNAMIKDDEVVAFLDLDQLCVADRCYDLARATWSCTWNYGPGYEDLFVETYGLRPDPQKIAYFRLLADLSG